jgi:hypothetical protein
MINSTKQYLENFKEIKQIGRGNFGMVKRDCVSDPAFKLRGKLCGEKDQLIRASVLGAITRTIRSQSFEIA